MEAGHAVRGRRLDLAPGSRPSSGCYDARVHDGLTLDPQTGWDAGPSLGRGVPSVRTLWTFAAVAGAFLVYGPDQLEWLFPCVMALASGAVVAVLGMEARALDLRSGVDTRSSRQLRFERAILTSLISAVAVLTCSLLALLSRTPFDLRAAERGVAGSCGAIGLVAIAVGLRLALKHRPRA